MWDPGTLLTVTIPRRYIDPVVAVPYRYRSLTRAQFIQLCTSPIVIVIASQQYGFGTKGRKWNTWLLAGDAVIMIKAAHEVEDDFRLTLYQQDDVQSDDEYNNE